MGGKGKGKKGARARWTCSECGSDQDLERDPTQPDVCYCGWCWEDWQSWSPNSRHGKGNGAKGVSKGKGKSKDGAKGKANGKGKGKGKSNEPHMPDPPVDAPGRWVRRDEFEGRSSFGFFSCDCGRSWTTARAQKEFRQGCQGCEREFYAYYMWQNDEKRPPRQREDTDDRDDPPHDSQRCEACRLGRCTLRMPWE